MFRAPPWRGFFKAMIAMTYDSSITNSPRSPMNGAFQQVMGVAQETRGMVYHGKSQSEMDDLVVALTKKGNLRINSERSHKSLEILNHLT